MGDENISSPPSRMAVPLTLPCARQIARKLGTAARPGRSLGSTTITAPGRSNRYRLPLTGPTAVSAVLPTYSNCTE